ncbi:MAG: hypothetical protein EU551_01805 [Promethearchaeota archaeon]|nr:MAG: hypothetical protein EU551_01805 [Candidatus Lokiarchaeota archaeon]
MSLDLFHLKVIKRILNSSVKWDILFKRSTVGMWQALCSTQYMMYHVFNDVGKILVEELKPKNKTVEQGVNLLEWCINYTLDIECTVDGDTLILGRCPFDKMRNEFLEMEEFKEVPYVWNCAYLFCRPVMLSVLKNLSKNLTIEVLENRPTDLMRSQMCDSCKFKVVECEDETFAQAITCGNEFRVGICKKEIQCTYGLGLIRNPKDPNDKPLLKQDCPCYVKIGPDDPPIIYREREFFKHTPREYMLDENVREDPKEECSDITTWVM